MGEDKEKPDVDTNSSENNTKLNSIKSELLEGNNENSNHSTKSNSNSDGNVSEKIAITTENGTDCNVENSSENNSTAEPNKEYKLRIVPLEKLLEKPQPIKQSTESHSQRTRSKILPVRQTRSNVSIIDLDDSEDTDDECIILVNTNKKTTSVEKGQRVATAGPKSKSIKTKNKNKSTKNCVVRLRRAAFPTISEENTPNKESTPNGIIGKNSEISTRSLRSSVRNKVMVSSDSDDSDSVMQDIAEEIEDIERNGNSDVSNSKSSDNEARSTKSKRISNRRKAASSASAESDSEKQESGKETKDLDKNGKSDESDGKSSDSEVMPVRKKRFFTKRKKSSGGSADSDFEPEERKPKGKKRRVVKKNSSDESGDDEKNKNKRKHIRKIIKTKDLDISTKTATKEEEERRKRIEERQKIYNQIYDKSDNIELKELVLDFDDETKKPLLEVDKSLLKKLKPHQVAGVKFMWDACFETLKDTEEKPGSGCILAHCMGLGKTLQIVSLVHTLLINSSKTKVERVLIISPLSTLTNWAREFQQWIGFAHKKGIEIYDMSKYKDKPMRIFKLTEWFEEGGVLILGYDMYRILANEKAKGLRKKQREGLQKALVEPGPDLVVCDEGHLLKNEKTSISKAVTKMRTKRRVVLTGTPLQNNLKEYYCMIQFVKPNLLGTYKEYLNRFVNPITNGQYTDSTERDIRLMKHRSHILHKLLEGCIQRRDYSVLAPYLPPKHEYVVYTTLSDLQQQLYEFYMSTQRDLSTSDMSGKGARLFQDFQNLGRIWTHPMSLRVNSDSIIRKRLLANDSDSMDDFICDDDEDEHSTQSSSDESVDSTKSFGSNEGGSNSKGGLKKRSTRANKVSEDEDDDDAPLICEKDDPSEWWKRFVEEKELNNINHSPKLVVLMRLLQQCEVIGDKLLVFSQSLQSLNVIEHFLALIDSKTRGNDIEGDVGEFSGHWSPGLDYFRLDGSCSVDSRENMCKQFNDVKNLRARLFLISTRAGGLGINLVAANRVVIFDVSWNPSHDTQSIFRVYRFGQVKPCYIYRLIAMGTMEQKLYERQVAKQATAKRVIDEQQISRHYNQSDLQELYTYELKSSTPREVPILPKDLMFAELLTEHEKLIFKYHEHDSLLENEESENLTEAERKAAWSEYEAEKTRSVQTAQYISYDRTAYGGNFGNASGSVTSNKIFGFRSDVLLQLLNMKIAKDHPEFTQNQILQMVPAYLQQLYVEMNNCDPTMYKELLSLHTNLAHPSGMYMNPLLYANQSPSAAGYYQAPGAQQPQQQQTAPVEGAAPLPETSDAPRPTPGFEPNKVYEID